MKTSSHQAGAEAHRSGSEPAALTPEAALALKRAKLAALGASVLTLGAGIAVIRRRPNPKDAAQRTNSAESVQRAILEYSTECAVLMGEDGRIGFISERGKRAIGE
jgi:hypothetical protein